MGNPRVLLIGQSVSGGGAERRMWYLAKHVFGGECDVVTFLPSSRDAVDELRTKPLLIPWYSEFSYPRICWRLRSLLRAKRYDLAGGFGMLASLPLWVAATGLKEPPRLLLFEINCPQRVLGARWDRFQTRATARLLRYAYSAADCVAANSIDGMRESIETFRAREETTVRVPNIIDPHLVTRLSRERVQIDLPRRPFVVMTARLVREKRHDLAILALALIQEDRRPTLVLVGDGPERTSLERMVRQLDVADYVRFLGWIGNPLPIVSKASVSLLCSDFEGFSNAGLEAMTLGVPVVSSRHSADVGDMERAKAALAFKCGDAAELAEKLKEILEDDRLRREIVLNAARYRRPHELPNAIPSYEKLFRDVAAGRVAGGASRDGLKVRACATGR